MKHYKPFQFKQFAITQNNAAMKVGTDSVLLGAWAIINQNERVLDIGTGTGLLSLMLAQKVDGNCIIDAVEMDEEAILDAEANFENCKWKESITLYTIDFNNYSTQNSYDVIISNPPFFEGLAPNITSRSIARNASDKLSYKNLLERASNLLRKEGRFYLIIPKEYYEKVIKIGLNTNLKLNRQLNIKPKNNKPINRVLIELVKNLDTAIPTKKHELVVRNSNNKYTPEHIAFTKEFYL